MKTIMITLIAVMSSCYQNTSETRYKSTSNETNGTLRFSGSKFQLSYRNDFVDVVPEVEQLASVKPFTAASVAPDQALQLSDAQTQLLFKIKVETETVICQINQTELKPEISLLCSEKSSSQKTEEIAEPKLPDGDTIETPNPSTIPQDHLTTLQQTYLKTSTTFSGDLPSDQKCSVSVNSKIFGKTIETQLSHYKFILSQDVQGCLIGKKGSTVFIYTGHVK